jgi:hypothetical protein
LSHVDPVPRRIEIHCMFAMRSHISNQRFGYSPVAGALRTSSNPFGNESVASPMIGKMAAAQNRIGHFVLKRFHRVRVSHAASSSHSVNKPQAGEVVFADTTARGYSTWGDSHEARLECELAHTQPCVQFNWTGYDSGQRCFTFGDVKQVQSIVPHSSEKRLSTPPWSKNWRPDVVQYKRERR